VRTNIANAAPGRDRAGCHDSDLISGAHVDVSVGATGSGGHIYSDVARDATSITITIAVVQAPRTNSGVPIFLDIARVQISLPANLNVERATRVSERTAIGRQEKATIAIRSELAIAAELNNRGPWVLADGADQFAFGSVWQRRSWIRRAQAVRTDSRTAHSNNSRGAYLNSLASVQINSAVDPIGLQRHLYIERFITRFIDRAALDLDAIDFFRSKILNVAFVPPGARHVRIRGRTRRAGIARLDAHHKAPVHKT